MLVTLPLILLGSRRDTATSRPGDQKKRAVIGLTLLEALRSRRF
jgi:hypothetical protein